jgi:branched-chain amino acid transport system permease protein
MRILLYVVLLALSGLAPFLFPSYGVQLFNLWLMIVVAMTWDMTGGQMGYNSLGNIFFYGTGMYVAAVVAIGMNFSVGEYTDAGGGGGNFIFTESQYFTGVFVGILAAGFFCACDIRTSRPLLCNWNAGCRYCCG